MLGIVALYAVVWIAFHVGAGYLAHRLPARLLAQLPATSGSYGWERAGRIYWRLGIRAWKDRLPEAGDFFPGGFSKRRLTSNEVGYFERFVLETIRAECSHWLTWALSLTFFAWNPWPVGILMVLYGAASNAPCILVQRYNRARLLRLVQTSGRRPHRDRAALPVHSIAHEREIEGAEEDRDEAQERYRIGQCGA
jgi:glycosyl-4,4'-diaponeurosporenoate acyltransferase